MWLMIMYHYWFMNWNKYTTLMYNVNNNGNCLCGVIWKLSELFSHFVCKSKLLKFINFKKSNITSKLILSLNESILLDGRLSPKYWIAFFIILTDMLSNEYWVTWWLYLYDFNCKIWVLYAFGMRRTSQSCYLALSLSLCYSLFSSISLTLKTWSYNPPFLKAQWES